jgi:DNA-binding transcriptional LysR family regulator
MDLVTALRIFDRAVATGSFSQVAREMGMSQPAASRHITMLEQRFGVALMHRSTRGIALTEPGRNLIEHARTVIDAVGQAEAALEGGRAVSGRVRVGVTVAFGHFLLERVDQLLNEHPGLVVELVMRDGFGSMIEENIDVAIRTGDVTDASLIMRLAAENGRFVVAAPSYLKSRDVPQEPFDLSRHDCVVYTGDTDEYEWRFETGEETLAVPISGRLRLNNRYAIRQAVLKGLGVGLLQHYMVADDIARGELVRLLPDHEPRPLPIHVVYPSRATLTRRSRVVIDWLLTVLKDTVGLA